MTQPRRAASIALFRGRDILLIRRALAPSEGMWTLPGGRLETGETIEECIRREISEELSLKIGAITPVMEQALGPFRLTVFAGPYPDGAVPHPNAEIVEWCWHVPGTELPVPHTDGLADVLKRATLALQLPL